MLLPPKQAFNFKYLFFILLAIFLIGLINLPLPFWGDQAFYLIGAKEMNEGLVLYHDYWDIKQPGIFFFYLAGGIIFGFNEIGIHLFELLYWLIFAGVLIHFLLRFSIFKNELITYISPLIIVGSYYSFTSSAMFTQVEALVIFPLMLVISFNFEYSRTNKTYWLFLSGIAGGLVIFFKLMFLPLLFAFWVVLFFQLVNKDGNFGPLIFKFLVIPLGILFFWLPFFIYCYKHDILQLCYDTFIKYPPLILKYGKNQSIERLVESVRIISLRLLLILPFTVASILFIRKNTFYIYLWLWLTIGLILILLQKTSWYTSHFQLLYFPIILLGLFSIQEIGLWLNKFKALNTKYCVYSLLIFINSFGFALLSKKVYHLSQYNFALTSQNRKNYTLTFKDNAKAIRIANALEKYNLSKCPVYVVNDPLVYYYTGRNQATAQSGWNLQLFIPGQVQILHSELKNTKPCFIYINKAFTSFFETKGIDIGTWISTHYRILNTDKEGTWYQFKS